MALHSFSLELWPLLNSRDSICTAGRSIRWSLKEMSGMTPKFFSLGSRVDSGVSH